MKSHDVRQLDAFKVDPSEPSMMSDKVVRCQPDFNGAVSLSIAAAGLDDKQVYGPLGIDHAQWSRIRNGTAYFPMRKYGEFRQIVGNDIVLQWLAFRSGYELKPLESDLERKVARLEEELAAERNKNEVILRFVKETRG
jgi:hypothetical protein